MKAGLSGSMFNAGNGVKALRKSSKINTRGATPAIDSRPYPAASVTNASGRASSKIVAIRSTLRSISGNGAGIAIAPMRRQAKNDMTNDTPGGNEIAIGNPPRPAAAIAAATIPICLSNFPYEMRSDSLSPLSKKMIASFEPLLCAWLEKYWSIDWKCPTADARSIACPFD